VNRAKLDFWHADSNGEYDNQGYRLRGHQFTDAQGRYRLETIATGEYSGRTRHIHLKVEPPGARELTTQLFFPGDPGNARDSIFREELQMQIQTTSDGLAATFDFVVRV
jgi:protocatechuate 3,4-dioxygenase beta subunit